MNPTAWHFRPAQPSDADACARLTFDAGSAEIRFFLLDESDERCIAFLRFAFATNGGEFSWRHHYVGCASDGTVLAETAIHDYRDVRLDGLRLIWALLRFFGLLKTLKILSRGTILEHEQPPPKRGQVLIRSYSVDKRAQASNVPRMLFGHAIASGWLRFAPDRQYLLNVRQDNRARHLYERLGFVVQPRQHPPSARLPAELESVCMVWSERGIQSVCERAVRMWGPLAQQSGAVPDTGLPAQTALIQQSTLNG
ncbi:MAG: N-acetyltransferase [Burkholderiaceae bacterium]|jgi:ribosomal protein S18 acetylase RimI-like enzyme|nr:N-acetyltransferase [Burkholderiaceae bacterium]